MARDLVARARSRGYNKRPDEGRALLDAAETLAVTGDDWTMIAEAWLALGDVHAGRRAIEAALAKPHDTGTYVHAALLLHRELGDAMAAHAALERCASWSETSQRADWARLAWSYVHTLGDRATARAIYERGARDPRSRRHDLIAIARGYVEELEDRDAALGVIRRAEAESRESIESGDLDVIDLAEAYRDLIGDEARARRLVDASLAATSSIRTALSIVRFAPRSKRDDALALERAGFAKAEATATTANDWLDIAEHYFDREPSERDQIRRCLQSAVEVAVSGEDRRRIAEAYRHRLNDAETAAKLGPTGLAPSQLVVVRHHLEEWAADPARLLEWLRPQLDRVALDTLAGSAGFAKQKHFAVIEDIHGTGLVPSPLGWYPREALEFERWKTGVDVDHRRRAFACAILLIDAAGPEFRDGFEATIALLVESCRELGVEALDGAIALLVALAGSFDPELPRFAFALFGLLLAAAARDPLDVRLPSLCDRLLTLVSGYERTFSMYTSEWLLGLTNFDSGHALFRSLVAALIGGPTSPPHLASIAARLSAR
ncbi:MAG: hypothetical protein ABI467_22945 [Kofleriaceae bacterium]